MGDAGMASDTPEAPDYAGSRTRSSWGERRARAEVYTDVAARQVLERLYKEHYRSLVRLAALLTGDAYLAEQIAAGALIAVTSRPPQAQAEERVLFQLRQHVVIKSRHVALTSRAPHRERLTHAAAQGHGSIAAWEYSPVVRALGSLSTSEREAIVLTHYLDLDENETAAIMGTGPHTVQRSLASAMTAVEAALPQPAAEED